MSIGCFQHHFMRLCATGVSGCANDKFPASELRPRIVEIRCRDVEPCVLCYWGRFRQRCCGLRCSGLWIDAGWNCSGHCSRHAWNEGAFCSDGFKKCKRGGGSLLPCFSAPPHAYCPLMCRCSTAHVAVVLVADFVFLRLRLRVPYSRA